MILAAGLRAGNGEVIEELHAQRCDVTSIHLSMWNDGVEDLGKNLKAPNLSFITP